MSVRPSSADSGGLNDGPPEALTTAEGLGLAEDWPAPQRLCALLEQLAARLYPDAPEQAELLVQEAHALVLETWQCAFEVGLEIADAGHAADVADVADARRREQVTQRIKARVAQMAVDAAVRLAQLTLYARCAHSGQDEHPFRAS